MANHQRFIDLSLGTTLAEGILEREKWAWWSILIAFGALNIPQIIVTQKNGGTPVLLSIIGFIVFLIAKTTRTIPVVYPCKIAFSGQFGGGEDNTYA